MIIYGDGNNVNTVNRNDEEDSKNETIPNNISSVVHEARSDQYQGRRARLNSRDRESKRSRSDTRSDRRVTDNQRNVKSKKVTELFVENEILKADIESMKKMQKLKEQEINDWKERYKRCKLELEQLK